MTATWAPPHRETRSVPRGHGAATVTRRQAPRAPGEAKGGREQGASGKAADKGLAWPRVLLGFGAGLGAGRAGPGPKELVRRRRELRAGAPDAARPLPARVPATCPAAGAGEGSLGARPAGLQPGHGQPPAGCAGEAGLGPHAPPARPPVQPPRGCGLGPRKSWGAGDSPGEAGTMSHCGSVGTLCHHSPPALRRKVCPPDPVSLAGPGGRGVRPGTGPAPSAQEPLSGVQLLLSARGRAFPRLTGTTRVGRRGLGPHSHGARVGTRTGRQREEGPRVSGSWTLAGAWWARHGP